MEEVYDMSVEYEKARQVLESFLEDTSPYVGSVDRFYFQLSRGDDMAREKVRGTFDRLSQWPGYERLSLFTTSEGLEYLVSYATERCAQKSGGILQKGE